MNNLIVLELTVALIKNAVERLEVNEAIMNRWNTEAHILDLS